MWTERGFGGDAVLFFLRILHFLRGAVLHALQEEIREHHLRVQRKLGYLFVESLGDAHDYCDVGRVHGVTLLGFAHSSAWSRPSSLKYPRNPTTRFCRRAS